MNMFLSPDQVSSTQRYMRKEDLDSIQLEVRCNELGAVPAMCRWLERKLFLNINDITATFLMGSIEYHINRRNVLNVPIGAYVVVTQTMGIDIVTEAELDEFFIPVSHNVKAKIGFVGC